MKPPEKGGSLDGTSAQLVSCRAGATSDADRRREAGSTESHPFGVRSLRTEEPPHRRYRYEHDDGQQRERHGEETIGGCLLVRKSEPARDEEQHVERDPWQWKTQQQRENDTAPLRLDRER